MKNLNAFVITALVIFIFYGIFLALGSQEGFPERRYGNGFFPFLSEKPLNEDGFYSLAVAWNIANGYGISYNREIETTGIQPLSVFIESAFAYVVVICGGNKYVFLRVVLVFSVLLQVVFAFLIYLIAESLTRLENKKLLLSISILCSLFNFKLFINFTNGLETGFYLLGLAYFFYLLLSGFKDRSNKSSTLLLGLISGLLLLTRADFIIILIFLLIVLYVRKCFTLQKVVLISLYSVIIYIPWLLYVYKVTGSFVPSSIQIQTGIISSFAIDQRLDHFFSSVIHYLTPFLYTGIQLKPLFYIAGIIYIVVLAYLFRLYYKEIFEPDVVKRFLLIALPFILLTLIYLFYSSAPYFYLRYFSPISVISLPLFVIIVSNFLLRARKIIFPVVYFLVLIVFFIHAILYLHVGKSSMSFAYRPGYIQKNFDEGIKIAAFQSGTLGYFWENVYNLDGKVDYNVIRYSLDGKLDRYLDSLGIDVLLAWEQYLPNLRDDYLLKNWDLYSKDIGDSKSLCFVRKNSAESILKEN